MNKQTDRQIFSMSFVQGLLDAHEAHTGMCDTLHIYLELDSVMDALGSAGFDTDELCIADDLKSVLDEYSANTKNAPDFIVSVRGDVVHIAELPHNFVSIKLDGEGKVIQAYRV